MSVGRNETCPCGSGKKFKACCAGKSARQASRGLMLLLGALGIIAAFGIVASIRDDDREKPRTSLPVAAAPANVPGPQPPGVVPPGKVWSAEHGHWHDQAPANPIQIQQSSPIQIQQGQGSSPTVAAPALTPGPQPPGAVPPGKVWSPEHGHWHDAPAPK